MTQKARGVGTIVLHAIRTGSGVRERVELVDVERFREGVAELNRVSHAARENLRTRQQTQTVNYTGVPGAPTSSPVPTATPHVDLNAELEKLADFRARGVLDDDEFAAAKRKLLGL